jgi:uncharacterized integral membrane protein
LERRDKKYIGGSIMSARLAIIISLIVLGAIVLIQNMVEPVEVQFLFITTKMPVLIYSIILLFIGYMLAVLVHRKKGG